MSAQSVDVLVVGGGPAGTLLAAQLAQFKNTVMVIEKEDKPNIPIYGRATTMWCRTLEMLDQLGMVEDLLEDGVYTRDGVNFRNGVAAPGGMPFGQRMDKHGDTRFGFSLHIRQRLIERVFEGSLQSHGITPLHKTELLDYSVSSDTTSDSEYPVTSTIRDMSTGNEYTVRSKFIVGCDGARSFVRKKAGIPFIGTRSANKWIRLDASVKTNMPSPRTLNSIQSEHHGLILWCPIDQGKVRIGFVWNSDLQAKYGEGEVTEEVVIMEAKKAVKPFELEFPDGLDWFTCYGIGQCMAEDFLKGRVILAGDSCHTHSSGSAQGLNTSIFDVTNLAWKLSLHLHSLAPYSLLESYASERKTAVQQVIDNDKIIATLISGQLPEKFKHRVGEHPRDILDEFFQSAQVLAFTLGLGIAYPKNNLINVTPVQPPIAGILPGQRGPEAFVTRLGTNERMALQRLMPNIGKFTVLIFAGLPSSTLSSLRILRSHLDSTSSSSSPSFFAKYNGTKTMNLLTIFGQAGISASETMGGLKSFGKTYYDTSLEAHQIYGVDAMKGGLVVFRPDGYVGRVAPLDKPEELVEYFGRFLEVSSGARQGAIGDGIAKMNGKGAESVVEIAAGAAKKLFNAAEETLSNGLNGTGHAHPNGKVNGKPTHWQVDESDIVSQ